MTPIVIELTEKEIYFLNKRNMYTSNREIGDWTGESVKILDKLTFNDKLPEMEVSFDKKKNEICLTKMGLLPNTR
jgi:hypothetical protein